MSNHTSANIGQPALSATTDCCTLIVPPSLPSVCYLLRASQNRQVCVLHFAHRLRTLSLRGAKQRILYFTSLVQFSLLSRTVAAGVTPKRAAAAAEPGKDRKVDASEYRHCDTTCKQTGIARFFFFKCSRLVLSRRQHVWNASWSKRKQGRNPQIARPRPGTDARNAGTTGKRLTQRYLRRGQF